MYYTGMGFNVVVRRIRVAAPQTLRGRQMVRMRTALLQPLFPSRERKLPEQVSEI